MKTFLMTVITVWISSMLYAAPLTCDLSRYKASAGLTAAVEQDALAIMWTGEQRTQLRLRLAIDAGKPVIREWAVRNEGGSWATLGRNLTPEFQVTSGVRRGDRISALQQPSFQNSLGGDGEKVGVLRGMGLGG